MIGGLTAVLAGIILSAVYSGLETGLYTINRVRLDVRRASGSAAARRLSAVVARPARMLAVVLVGNNIANYLASYGAARMLSDTELTPWQAIGVNTLVLVPLLFVFGEILPKDLFRAQTDRWTYACAPIFWWSDRLMTVTGLVPLVALMGRVASSVLGSEQDVRPSPRQQFGLLFREGLGSGAVSAEQASLADRALAMRELTVRSEMVPWHRVQRLADGVSPERRTTVLRTTKCTRLPVLDNAGRVRGVLGAIDGLLEPEAATEDLLQEVMTIDADMPVRDALQELRRAGGAMAIVAAPSGRPVGVVTLKDLVEPLVGDLAAW